METAEFEEMHYPVAELERGDSEIIAAVIAGSKDEFRFLVMRYQGQVLAMIMRQVGDRTIAEELAQDTFIRAFRSLHQFRGDAKFSTWLVQIALNVSRSYFSSRRYKERQKTVTLEKQELRQEKDDSAEIKYSPDQVEKLRAAMQKLTPVLRDALVLCGLERKSYEEAAQILKIPVGTVRSRLNRARERLQQLYFEVVI